MASLLSLGLIASVAVTTYFSLTQPAPPATERRQAKDYSFIQAANIVIYKYSCLLHGAIEAYHIVTKTLEFVDPGGAQSPAVYFSPLRVLSAFLTISGNCIRFLCYRELGNHFSFHIVIVEGHQLVTTGPYSIVRHPSYVGGYMLHIGIILWHISPGAWIRESNFYMNPISWLFIVPSFLMFCGFTRMLLTRPEKEDKLLKEEFGAKWDQYAKRVPYRYIPGIY